MVSGEIMEERKYPTRLKMVGHFLRGSKRWFFLAVIFACLVSLFELISPKLIAFTVDSVIGDQVPDVTGMVKTLLEAAGGTAYLKGHLGMIALLIMAAAFASALCRYLFRLFNAKGAETLVKTMRDDLFSHILRLPFQWHSENHTGDIIQRCTSDVEQIKMFLSEQLTSLIRILILITLAVWYMFGIHKTLSLTAVAYIVIVVSYSYYFHHKIGDAFEKVDIEEGRLSSIAQENLTGVRVVRAFGRETYEKEWFEKQNAHYTGLWVHLLNILAAFWSSGDLISNLQILVILAMGSALCVRGSLSAGNFIAFISYNSMLIWPTRALGRVISNLSKAGISIDRLMYIMNAEEEKDDDNAAEPPMNGDICFEHVSFRFANANAEALNDIDFTIKAGTTVGILGGTGSGKSTLMYLLDRLYDLPEDSGRITVGGTDIRMIRRNWLRSHIGMVLQEPYLFSRTLEENIRIASQKSDRNEVRRAARIAALDETVGHFAEGYDTYVGERGVTLSGGQKQRTAIAQMLIRKPPVMIFDDSLSAVDAETDARIRRSLQENTAGSTIILISHRITTLMNADDIIVMDQGRVIEHGSHDELMEKNGIYRKIHDLQYSQSEQEEDHE